MFVFSKRALIAGAAATLALLGAGVPALAQQDKVKAAFVYVGPVGDHGWTYAHDVARKALEEKFGDKVETSVVENVAEGPDAERVIRQLAQAGNDIIFTTSFGYMNPTIKVARQFPKVKFEHATGYQRAPNVATYNARFYEGRAVLGTLAAKMSKTGKAGYIASFPIPEVVMGINAFTQAARKVNPDFETKVVWVNTWYDPAKEADAAKALIDQGADVIAQHTDSPAALQAAQQRGVYAFGQASDMSSFAPDAHLTAIVNDWAPYYIDRIQKVLDGTWESGDTWSGLKEGTVVIPAYNAAVTPEAKEAAEKVRNDIASGAMHPLQGPVKDQTGAVRIPEGQRPADEDLLKMDWFVEGVQS